MEHFTLEFRVFQHFFYDIFMILFYERKRRIVKIKCWCVFHYLLVQSTRDVARIVRPATSCRAFLLRTLPPPPSCSTV